MNQSATLSGTGSHSLSSNTFKPFLNDLGGTLANLELRARQVIGLTDKVRQALPDPERQHVLAAVYHEDALVITTDSAAWTAQIRFGQGHLRERLVAAGEKTFIHLKVRVGHGGEPL
jgi:hypothetical protein